MIDILPDLPSNVVGFKATGEVTREDFEKIIFPGIKKHMDTSRKLNFVFFVDTPLRNFSVGAWIRDIWLGIKKFAAWHKVAIISDVEKIRNFTDSVSHILPGEYRGFLSAEFEEAVRWAAMEEQNMVIANMPAYIEALLPPQIKGESTGTSASVTADKEEEAQLIFERAAERLLDVNNWVEHCTPLTTNFQLADETGEPLQGRATEGDFIQIDLPGPGPRAGQGYDWVKIEKIASPPVKEADRLFLIQVRPSPDPQIKGSDETAHFLENSATSTFVIGREGKKVTATVFGRNEIPNTHESEGIDKLRNAAVGTIGAIGLSKVQWKSLVEGLLEKE